MSDKFDSSEKIALEIEKVKQREETKRHLGSNSDYLLTKCWIWLIALSMIGAPCCTVYEMYRVSRECPSK